MAVETPGVIPMSGYLFRNRTVELVRYGMAVTIEAATEIPVHDGIQTRLRVRAALTTPHLKVKLADNLNSLAATCGGRGIHERIRHPRTSLVRLPALPVLF